jgi:hypothetical protein
MVIVCVACLRIDKAREILFVPVNRVMDKIFI